MHFSGLRLSGFKSFLDSTELEIAPGLTGIVGPNGCGKSNLVEALRWVMGESSPKRMRGGEMDDVIFGGSASRPARNIAEVSLTVDNRDRMAPAQFNDQEDMSITRRIERGQGSDYLVNGKVVRAKDVSLLFQDSATGPSSAALVSQGRIGALIAAKPTERRLLLEEAAGITGLHTRRHEAELKLKAAEANLLRLEDVLGTMEAQLAMLKKQARQASRYRNINSEVRRQEAALLHLRWSSLQTDMQDAEEAFKLADQQVGALMLQVAQLETQRTTLAADMPPLRQTEAEAAAILQRLSLAKEQLEAEAQRVAVATDAAQQRRAQALADMDRERALADDALKAMDGIMAETATLTELQQGTTETKAKLEARAVSASEARRNAEEAVQELQQLITSAEARAEALNRQLADLAARRGRAEQRRADLQRQREQIEAEKLSDLFVNAALREAEAADARQADKVMALEGAEQRRTEADAAVVSARQNLQQAEAARGALAAEKQGLERILAASASDHPPVLDKVQAGRGFEQALAAALGDDLALPTDSAAHAYWQQLPGYAGSPDLPAGSVPLSDHIQAPPELARRLAHIGVVADGALAAHLAPQLQPGQCLVTPDGGAWRWDGVVIKAGAPTGAAMRLQQRNRLAELAIELTAAESVVTARQHELAAVVSVSTEATASVREAREAQQAAFAEVGKARRAAAEAEAALSAANTRLAGITDAQERVVADIAALLEEEGTATAARASVPDVSAGKQQLIDKRNELLMAQSAAADAEAERRQFERESEARTQRLASLEADKQRWQQRSEGAALRITELDTRAAQAAEELSQLASRPAEIDQQRASLLGELSTAEANRRQAADALMSAENTLNEAEKLLKQAEHAAADAREARARAQAEVGNVQQAQANLVERIAEKCECTPEGLMAMAELEEGQPLPAAEAIEARLEKLLRERDALGPVNLRAEQEVDEQQTAIDTMQAEKNDLIEAIAKLRGGISSLNKEARERLLSAYDLVNGHFKRLFTRLFGGGSAELKLTEADDPLDAGLEIIASPPGKKLQNLNLLSGGEQALTSTALIFAVFMVNPSPICVLDEVDAPLDEANIDRFCSLLEDMSREGKTRFLLITHQRMTMSRMHRLYGVTMMEKGVSKLVSVNLDAADELRGAA